MVRAAAIYARISSDPEGDRLGVNRQVEDCRALAARKDWPVAGEYVDDDKSAWSGKVRPEYERMLGDMRAGAIDAVVVWHPDRLHRRNIELEAFIEVCKVAKITDVAYVGGELPVGAEDGLLVARILAAVASDASAKTSKRIKRKNVERAHAGLPTGGGNRPFGYDESRLRVNPVEAGRVREAADRVLAGESVIAVARDWNGRGIRTTTGGDWTVQTLRRMLASARLSGQVEYLGEIVGPGQWPAILTVDETTKLRAILDERTRSRRRPPRRYLLASLLRCGLCGATLVSRPQANGERRYICAKGPGHSGCGRLAIKAEPIEGFVSEAILERLDSPALAAALAGAAEADAATAAEHRALREDEDQLDDLARQWASRDISSSEWRAARDIIEARITTTRRKIERLSRSSAIDAFVGHAADLRAIWKPLPLDRQRSIVSALLDRAIVRSAVRGRAAFDPDRIEPVWKDG
ncbi:MAG TPA: recombinase family protein [Candidatus Limnocylindrales bacterium]|nr:recombinase family protein [Candidatus Limnocylindrales bacterium]